MITQAEKERRLGAARRNLSFCRCGVYWRGLPIGEDYGVPDFIEYLHDGIIENAPHLDGERFSERALWEMGFCERFARALPVSDALDASPHYLMIVRALMGASLGRASLWHHSYRFKCVDAVQRSMELLYNPAKYEASDWTDAAMFAADSSKIATRAANSAQSDADLAAALSAQAATIWLDRILLASRQVWVDCMNDGYADCTSIGPDYFLYAGMYPIMALSCEGHRDIKTSATEDAWDHVQHLVTHTLSLPDGGMIHDL